MSSPQTQGPTLVQAIYSFKGKNNDELCFKKGDIITVTQKEEGGWWEGTLAGMTGWFPSNYVKEHKPQGVIIDGCKTSGQLPADITIQQKVYRNLVLKDLIDSEKAHVAELQTLINNFLHPLEKSEILNRDEYRQLVGNIDAVVEIHSNLLIALEACNELPTLEQRVGKIFLTTASQIKQIHLSYCSSHPRAICILNKHKNALNTFMEAQGAASPGLLVLTTGLSKPFRRLEKYSGILQELERHIEENHPDRGDTQRSFSVYKDIWSACSAKRRQKEQELEILTGGVRGWEGEELSTLGEIIHMGSVAVGPHHRDRYLVLFPTTLLILSVSSRMSGFIYEGKLPLTGINVNQLSDSEAYKNAFEITGPLIDKIIAVCQTKEDLQIWVDALRQAIQSLRKSSALSFQSNPTPHVSSCFTCPYSGLTEYFANLVRSGIITRALLKRLLYRQFADESVSVLGVKIRRSHKVECVIFPTQISFDIFKSSETWLKSQTVELETSSSSSEENLRSLKRQDAIDWESRSSEESGNSDCFGYIRYFPAKSKQDTENKDSKNRNVIACSSSKNNGSQSGESSFDAPIPVTHRACEDLSALEIIEAVTVEEVPTRSSLPSFASNVRHSVEVTNFHKRASLDLVNFLKLSLNSDKCELHSASQDLVFRTTDEKKVETLNLRNNFKEKAQGSLKIAVSNSTSQKCNCEFTRLVQGLPGCSYEYRKDVFSSLRSSDSGLADIAGAVTVMSSNNPQNGPLWNARTDSLYDLTNNLTLSQVPVTSDEFEAQCICSSPFGSTPRASAQISLTSKNIFLEPSCSYFDPQVSVSGIKNQENVGNGIYRSGMYAHWWLKTRIPAEATDDSHGSSDEISKGKNSVPLTISREITNKGFLNKSPAISWRVTSLRPLPPVRPYVALGKNTKSKSSFSPKKSIDNNFEEDIQILRVIEAYCSSAKTRSANSSGEPAYVSRTKEIVLDNSKVCNKEKYVIDSVNLLRTQLTDLSAKVNVLSLKLDEEIETRTVLQNSVKLQLSKLGNGKN